MPHYIVTCPRHGETVELELAEECVQHEKDTALFCEACYEAQRADRENETLYGAWLDRALADGRQVATDAYGTVTLHLTDTPDVYEARIAGLGKATVTRPFVLDQIAIVAAEVEAAEQAGGWPAL